MKSKFPVRKLILPLVLLFIIIIILVFIPGKEETIILAPGESTFFGEKFQIILESFEEKKLPGENIKDLISTVSVLFDGKQIVTSYPLGFDNPLNIKRMRLSQFSSTQKFYITLEYSGGKRLYFPRGHNLPGIALQFAGVEEDPNRGLLIVLEQWKEENLLASYKYPPGSKLGEFVIVGVASRVVSKMKVRTSIW